jgi:hypothetical protein
MIPPELTGKNSRRSGCMLLTNISTSICHLGNFLSSKKNVDKYLFRTNCHCSHSNCFGEHDKQSIVWRHCRNFTIWTLWPAREPSIY